METQCCGWSCSTGEEEGLDLAQKGVAWALYLSKSSEGSERPQPLADLGTSLATDSLGAEVYRSGPPISFLNSAQVYLSSQFWRSCTQESSSEET